VIPSINVSIYLSHTPETKAVEQKFKVGGYDCYVRLLTK